ncbi:sensor domain-containing diguanylate cyclase [Jidongwangia harbinensis]|uniref:sensor domain-containing diguanylate cyclase n=1 Tax=Jidongwangia harbinensis TaxID=2878561 RepID=UPI001CD94163|nr:sensor domain-containing diguanylate cyclase [Jidongwangia harbinensis]MCA2211790.1 diguanylate cyclase [Jidongwangia harbinensis]
MRIRGNTTLALSTVSALVLIGLVACYLVYTDRAAGDRLRDEFAQRAAVAGELTSGAFTASHAQNKATAEQLFGGDSRSVQAALEADATMTFSTVLTADGTIVAGRPEMLRRASGQALVATVFKLALDRSTMVFDNLRNGPNGQMLLFGVPYQAAGGTRVWIGSVPLETINAFAASYLSSSLGLREGHAYIVDANGLLIARTGAEKIGAPLPEDRLAAAVRNADAGRVGEDYYAAAGVPGTGWRVIFVAPERVLLEPIQPTRRLAWQIFGAFVLAMVCMMVFGVTALTRSARLAYERQHDALTGLPNRMLFIERVDRALTERRPAEEKVAVLFIDLDGFKPINDAYGHAAGDALLTAVANRLADSARRGDVVCRFGGDEFLVLCAGLTDDQQAVAIADRLRIKIADPYQIEGHTVRVGSSIGVALQDRNTDGTTALIHHADLAMYQAKKAGGERVEVFRTAPAPAPIDVDALLHRG